MKLIINPIVFVVLSLASFVCQSESVVQRAERCFVDAGKKYSEVLACYRKAHVQETLQYTKQNTQHLDGAEKRAFLLTSQDWSPQPGITPAAWTHDVTIYIPADARQKRALLIVNNGINYAGDKEPIKEATDLSENTLLSIAKKTQTIVISVSNVPNQYLRYADGGLRKEDDSVAYSWRLFLNNPEKNAFTPLQVPMTEAVVKAMDLAEQELKPQHINEFILAGASKRGWAVWLTAVVDTRVTAIVPFVIDILNTREVVQYTFKTYGNNWPLAFGAYLKEKVVQDIDTEQSGKLMQIVDPLQYEHSAYKKRLAIPKYVVNASSDEFFVSDNARFYFDHLQGEKSLRVAPNSGHYGIKDFVESALETSVLRLQASKPLPTVTATLHTGGGVDLRFSEPPLRVMRWTAANSDARDFRFPCGHQYESTSVTPQGVAASTTFIAPKKGWTASFVEAQFSDGFVATSRVYITPDAHYPNSAPPVVEPYCKTLP